MYPDALRTDCRNNDLDVKCIYCNMQIWFKPLLLPQDLPGGSSKHKFQLIHVAQTRITFSAESHEEMVSWQKAMRDATAEGLSTNSDR